MYLFYFLYFQIGNRYNNQIRCVTNKASQQNVHNDYCAVTSDHGKEHLLGKFLFLEP